MTTFRAISLLAAMLFVAMIFYEIPVAMGAPRWVARWVNVLSWLALALTINPRAWRFTTIVAMFGCGAAFLENPAWFRASIVGVQIGTAAAWCGVLTAQSTDWYRANPGAKPWGAAHPPMTVARALFWVGVLAGFAGAGWAAALGYARGTGPVDPFAAPGPGGVAGAVGVEVFEIAAAIMLVCIVTAVCRSGRRSPR